MFELPINYIAVIVGAVMAWVGGAIYYGVLSKPWMAAVGLTKEDVKRTGAAAIAPFVLSFLFEIVMAYMLARLFHGLGYSGMAAGAALGGVVWLGFLVPVVAVNNLYPGRKLALTVIDLGHWLMVLLVIGAIIGAFN